MKPTSDSGNNRLLDLVKKLVKWIIHHVDDKWKSKYGGLDESQLRRLKELEEENRRLKRMYADLSLDHMILKDIIEKKLS